MKKISKTSAFILAAFLLGLGVTTAYAFAPSQTCGGGSFFNSVSSTGSFNCGTPAAGTIASTTPWNQGDIVTVSGTFYVASMSSGTYYRIANNLSDITNTSTARNNIGFTFAATSPITVATTSAGLTTYACATCLTANQSITLTGAVTGSGATTIATTFTTSTLYGLFSGTSPITFSGSTGAVGLNLGTYMATSGSNLTVSSTLASSTWSLNIQNATTTASTTNYASVRSPQARTITNLFCYDSVGTTTLNIFIPTTFATITVSSTISGSFACGVAGHSATSSVSIAAGSYVDVMVSSTAGTPVGTFLYIDGTKL